MTSHNVRAAAWTLIGFNLAGTLVTWLAHLSKSGTDAGHAVLQGTEFTGPIVFIAIWIVCTVALGGSTRVATVATWLMTLFALGFAVGEVSELTKSNIGVSSTKWATIVALDLVGLAIALTVVATGALAIVRNRRTATPHNPSLKEARS